MEIQGFKLENNDGNLKVSPIPFSLNLQVPVTLLLKDKKLNRILFIYVGLLLN